MHELAIAQDIIDIVQQSVPLGETYDIEWVRVRVGQFSGVVPESLEFCFSAIVSGTTMERANLEIERVPAISQCKDCRHRFDVHDLALSCPACNSTNLELVSGNELEVVEIQLADDREML